VKLGELADADLVGPTGVAVGVDPALDTPPAPPVEIVPFDGGAGDPVEPEPLPVLVPEIIEERVLEGQYVVVYVEVVIVEPILEIVVTVAVVLLEVPVPDTDEAVELNGLVVVIDWDVEYAVLMLVEVPEAEDEDEIAVQFGRVNVPLKLPDPPYTTQFLEHAASPLVLEVSQHGA